MMSFRFSFCAVLVLACSVACAQDTDPFGDEIPKKPEDVRTLQGVSKTWIWKDDERAGVDFAIRLKGERIVEIHDLRVLQREVPRLKTLFIPEYAKVTDDW